LIIPGVAGNSQEGYIMELADQACSNGFNVLIINPITPPDGDETQLEVCDFSKNIYLIQAVEMLKE
jgi:hypothetical protein